MKKTLVFLALVLSGVSQAQTFHAAYSEKFSLRLPKLLFDRDGYPYRSGEASYLLDYVWKGEIVLIRKPFNLRYAPTIYRYDMDMKETAKVEFHPQKDLAPFAPQLFVFGGRPLLFYYKTDGGAVIRLYFTEFDPLTLAVKQEKEVCTITIPHLDAVRKLEIEQEPNQLAFAANPAGTQLLVSQSGNTNIAFSCIIDQQLNVTGKVEIPVGDKLHFYIPSCALDGQGNRYFSCAFEDKKDYHWAALVVSLDGHVSWPIVSGKDGAHNIGAVGFYFSRAGTPYVYANYGEKFNLRDGVMLAKLVFNGPQVSMADPVFAAYPEGVGENLARPGYSTKVHGKYGIRDVSYRPTEMQDGTVVLYGYVTYDQEPVQLHLDIPDHFAGPVFVVFFNKGDNRFGILNRSQENSEGGGVVALPYGDKLLLIYNVSEDNLASKEPAWIESSAKAKRLVPVAALMSSSGEVLQRKLLVAKEKGVHYCTSYARVVSDKRVVIPMGQLHTDMESNYTDISQWVTFDIE